MAKKITIALVIAEPWIEMILAGHTFEKGPSAPRRLAPDLPAETN